MINARNVTFKYKDPVLTGLNLTLEPNRIHGLIGPNGAGKSTLMRILAGQLPCEGEVLVGGEPPFDDEKVMTSIVLSGADMGFPQNWSAQKILGLGAKRWPTFDLDRAMELLAAFEVPDSNGFGKLSLGQKSAVSLVFGLAARCPFTLLDEPYLGIDAQRRELLYRTLLDEQEQAPRTILLSTHHINESARVLDTVHLLEKGRIALSSDAVELVDSIHEVTGPTSALEQVELNVIRREVVGGITKLIMRGEVPEISGVRVDNVDLETAVLALQEG